MKKWMLALCLLFTCATIFVACGKGGDSTGTDGSGVSTESETDNGGSDLEMPPLPLPPQ